MGTDFLMLIEVFVLCLLFGAMGYTLGKFHEFEKWSEIFERQKANTITKASAMCEMCYFHHSISPAAKTSSAGTDPSPDASH